MTQPMRGQLLAALIVAAPSLAAAQGVPNVPTRSPAVAVVNPVLPPAGFGVQDTGLNGSGYYPFDLATSAAANWGIVAYSNPPNEPYLNAFTETTTGTVTQYATTSSGTAAQGMTVTLTHDSATNLNSQTISQAGVTTGTGCSGSVEFDLFLDANSATPPNGDPTYPSAYVASAPKPTLDMLSGIMLTANVALVSQASSTSPALSPCAINQGAMLYSLVFNNAVSSQTLFYQLDLNYFCYYGSSSDFNSFCAATIPSEGYFETGAGGVWGIDDPINNYANAATGAAYALMNRYTPVNLELNFLPRVAALIQAGQYGLDTNLSHWTLGSFYYGQHTWGSAVMASKWTSLNLAPSLVYRP